MTVGLRIPIGVTPTGGLALVEKDEQAQKIIALALSSSESRNAFQQEISLEDDMIFANDGAETRAKILRRIVSVFRRFEQEETFKLKRETIRFTSDPKAQMLTVEFDYVNLESDEPESFRRDFRFAGR